MVELTCTYVIAPREPMRVELLFSHDPISFFGGVNAADGRVLDYRHGNYQHSMTDKAFAFPFGKGSSGAGLVLMEMERLKTAPAAIINIRTDPVILTGPLISKHFHDQLLPVINLSPEDYAGLEGKKVVELFPTGNTLRAFNQV
ncbi:predicted aconitase subunit 2 [Desulfocicer vacuolatum DSM 3385]|uniref:Predicted aconitase subunit 2 n=1 Tax=Desulfocicer vacuolatum DSM 3385 TaxID=1121400 RepID=A0A1W2AV29_9BACT|nr:DUF126 domain-containing protein [Desulfocicer vacuolatum]SMC64291.1 predicted aconitase subunit 2 [Desulfocicer vacuolatum DSM 3385]